MKWIDTFLNSITMYRLVLYYLIVLLVVGGIGTFFHLLPFTFGPLVFNIALLVIVSVAANYIFVKLFKAAANVESVYISALILALIFWPAKNLNEAISLAIVAILMVASKFVFNVHRKHIFNPVAIAAVIAAFVLPTAASWWVGTAFMLPVVLVGGLLMVRKLRREDMVFTFIAVALAAIVGWALVKGDDPLNILKLAIIDTPLFFFAFVMFTEPLTTPPTKKLQMIYAALVGFLFAPQLHVLGIGSTPELALSIGNVFSFLVSPPYKLMLTLKQKIQLSSDQYDFVFLSDKPFKFDAGQYFEWTLGHPWPDDRGNRRYFTLASSPTETEVQIGVKFYQPASSYKRKLLSLEPGECIVAGNLAGDFTLPKDPAQKLVFIAGGIGITPFRSMVKYLVDKQEKRDIVLMYANKHADEIVYKDVFDQGDAAGVLRTLYVLSDKEAMPPGWTGQVGHIDPPMIESQIPDYKERMFYLSGPHTMVSMFEATLQQIGVPKNHIKIDFFPGFA